MPVALITPLVIVLSVAVGLGIGWMLVQLVTRDPPKVQRERELAIAKDTARRTVNETLQWLFGDQQKGTVERIMREYNEHSGG